MEEKVSKSSNHPSEALCNHLFYKELTLLTPEPNSSASTSSTSLFHCIAQHQLLTFGPSSILRHNNTCSISSIKVKNALESNPWNLSPSQVADIAEIPDLQFLIIFDKDDLSSSKLTDLENLLCIQDDSTAVYHEDRGRDGSNNTIALYQSSNNIYSLILPQASFHDNQEDYIHHLLGNYASLDSCTLAFFRQQLFNLTMAASVKYFHAFKKDLLNSNLNMLDVIDEFACQPNQSLHPCKGCCYIPILKRHAGGYENIKETITIRIQQHVANCLEKAYQEKTWTNIQIETAKNQSLLDLLKESTLMISKLEDKSKTTSLTKEENNELQFHQILMEIINFDPDNELLSNNFTDIIQTLKLKDLAGLKIILTPQTFDKISNIVTNQNKLDQLIQTAITILYGFILKGTQLEEGVVSYQARSLSLAQVVSKIKAEAYQDLCEVQIYATHKLFMDGNIDKGTFSSVNIIINSDQAILSKSIEINVSGREGEPATPIKFKELDDGRAGEDGADGNPGTHAGHVFISCNSFKSINSTDKIKIVANGGNGSAGLQGQNGADGKPGENGVDGNPPQPNSELEYRDMREGTAGKDGQPGGCGGAGGRGGRGGLPGKITLSAVIESVIIKENAHGEDGKNGPAGEGGNGGIGGTDGRPRWYFWEFSQIWSPIGSICWQQPYGELELRAERRLFTRGLLGYKWKYVGVVGERNLRNPGGNGGQLTTHGKMAQSKAQREVDSANITQHWNYAQTSSFKTGESRQASTSQHLRQDSSQFNTGNRTTTTLSTRLQKLHHTRYAQQITHQFQRLVTPHHRRKLPNKTHIITAASVTGQTYREPLYNILSEVHFDNWIKLDANKKNILIARYNELYGEFGDDVNPIFLQAINEPTEYGYYCLEFRHLIKTFKGQVILKRDIHAGTNTGLFDFYKIADIPINSTLISMVSHLVTKPIKATTLTQLFEAFKHCTDVTICYLLEIAVNSILFLEINTKLSPSCEESSTLSTFVQFEIMRETYRKYTNFTPSQRHLCRETLNLNFIWKFQLYNYLTKEQLRAKSLSPTDANSLIFLHLIMKEDINYASSKEQLLAGLHNSMGPPPRETFPLIAATLPFFTYSFSELDKIFAAIQNKTEDTDMRDFIQTQLQNRFKLSLNPIIKQKLESDPDCKTKLELLGDLFTTQLPHLDFSKRYKLFGTVVNFSDVRGFYGGCLKEIFHLGKSSRGLDGFPTFVDFIFDNEQSGISNPRNKFEICMLLNQLHFYDNQNLTFYSSNIKILLSKWDELNIGPLQNTSALQAFLTSFHSLNHSRNATSFPSSLDQVLQKIGLNMVHDNWIPKKAEKVLEPGRILLEVHFQLAAFSFLTYGHNLSALEEDLPTTPQNPNVSILENTLKIFSTLKETAIKQMKTNCTKISKLMRNPELTKLIQLIISYLKNMDQKPTVAAIDFVHHILSNLTVLLTKLPKEQIAFLLTFLLDELLSDVIVLSWVTDLSMLEHLIPLAKPEKSLTNRKNLVTITRNYINKVLPTLQRFGDRFADCETMLDSCQRLRALLLATRDDSPVYKMGLITKLTQHKKKCNTLLISNMHNFAGKIILISCQVDGLDSVLWEHYESFIKLDLNSHKENIYKQLESLLAPIKNKLKNEHFSKIFGKELHMREIFTSTEEEPLFWEDIQLIFLTLKYQLTKIDVRESGVKEKIDRLATEFMNLDNKNGEIMTQIGEHVKKSFTTFCSKGNLEEKLELLQYVKSRLQSIINIPTSDILFIFEHLQTIMEPSQIKSILESTFVHEWPFHILTQNVYQDLNTLLRNVNHHHFHSLFDISDFFNEIQEIFPKIQQIEFLLILQKNIHVESALFDAKTTIRTHKLIQILSSIKTFIKKHKDNSSLLTQFLNRIQISPIEHWNKVAEYLEVEEMNGENLAPLIFQVQQRFSSILYDKFIELLNQAVEEEYITYVLETILPGLLTGQYLLTRSNYENARKAIWETVSIKNIRTEKIRESWNKIPSQTKPADFMHLFKRKENNLDANEVFQLLKDDARNSKLLLGDDDNAESDNTLRNLYSKYLDEHKKLEMETRATLQQRAIGLFAKRREARPLEYVLSNQVQIMALISCIIENKLGFQLTIPQVMSTFLFIKASLEQKQSVIGEIQTSEGKSVITAIVTIFNVLANLNVDIITSSRGLSGSTLAQVKKLYDFFGISVGNLCDARDDVHARSAMYQKCQVLIGDLASFQADYILCQQQRMDIMRGRRADRIIVDEIDSMILDKVENTLYMAHSNADLTYLRNIYMEIWLLAVQLSQQQEYIANETGLKEAIVNQISSRISENYLPIPHHMRECVVKSLPICVENAVHLTQRNNHNKEINDSYVLIAENAFKRRRIMVMDKPSGEEQPDLVLTHGYHQFLELINGQPFTLASVKADFISNVSYFHNFNNPVLGMTGTLGSSAEREMLYTCYKIYSFFCPRAKTRQCETYPGTVCTSVEEHLKEIRASSDNITKFNRSILIGCENVESCDRFYNHLQSNLPKNELANLHKYSSAFHPPKKSDGSLLFDSPLAPRQIIVATNISGRGTDIKLSPELLAAQGLHLLMTFVPPTQREEDQFRGRVARNGQPGSVQFVIYSEKQGTTLESLKKQRDIDEIQRLHHFRVTGLQRIQLEQFLHGEAVQYQRQLLEDFEKQGKHPDFIQIQGEYFKNRWAFWLDSHTQEDMENTSLHKNILKLFKSFEKQMTLLTSSESIIGFAQGCTELTKLSEYYILVEKNYTKSLYCLDVAISTDPLTAEFAYYSKAKLLLDNNPDGIASRKTALRNFNSSRKLFTLRLDDIRLAQVALRMSYLSKQRTGVGLPSSTAILKQLSNEEKIWKEFAFTLDDLIGFPFAADSLINDAKSNKFQLSRESANIIMHCLEQHFADSLIFKGLRLNKKVVMNANNQPCVKLFGRNRELELPVELSYLKSNLCTVIQDYLRRDDDSDSSIAFLDNLHFETQETLWLKIIHCGIIQEDKKITMYQIKAGSKAIQKDIIRMIRSNLPAHISQKLNTILEILTNNNGKAFEEYELIELLSILQLQPQDTEALLQTLHSEELNCLISFETRIATKLKELFARFQAYQEQNHHKSTSGILTAIPTELVPFQDIITAGWFYGNKENLYMHNFPISGSKDRLIDSLIGQGFIKRSKIRHGLLDPKPLLSKLSNFLKYNAEIKYALSKSKIQGDRIISRYLKLLHSYVQDSLGGLITFQKLIPKNIQLSEAFPDSWILLRSEIHQFEMKRASTIFTYEMVTQNRLKGSQNVVNFVRGTLPILMWMKWIPLSTPWLMLLDTAVLIVANEIEIKLSESYWDDKDKNYNKRKDYIKSIAWNYVWSGIAEGFGELGQTQLIKGNQYYVKLIYTPTKHVLYAISQIRWLCSNLKMVLQFAQDDCISPVVFDFLKSRIVKDATGQLLDSEDFKAVKDCILTENVPLVEIIRCFEEAEAIVKNNPESIKLLKASTDALSRGMENMSNIFLKVARELGKEENHTWVRGCINFVTDDLGSSVAETMRNIQTELLQDLKKGEHGLILGNIESCYNKILRQTAELLNNITGMDNSNINVQERQKILQEFTQHVTERVKIPVYAIFQPMESRSEEYARKCRVILEQNARIVCPAELIQNHVM